MRFLKHILNVLCLVLIVSSSWAQSEDEVRKNADKLFEQEAYVSATPLYLQLLNLYPTDPELNFKYGTCSLFNDDKEKKDAIKFLNVATKSNTIDPRAFYFKGKALHLNYQFDEAKKFYKMYQSKRSSRDDRYDVDREIEMCQNGKKLMVQFTDIIVSEKTQINDDKFFRLYKDMQSIGGDILVTERFQSKLDRKRGHVPIVHYPKDAKAVYYSSYGDNGKTGLDIYVRKRLPDNSWGEPYRLPGEINTEHDEDFPYLHPNGRYLYFSSKGHNSMGGFDVFFARFNPDINQFQSVENVDFAICSPDDDLFYVVDADYQNAYFASSRQSEEGKLHVYQVKVIRIPIQEIIVMGDFTSEINPDNKNMTIDITSVATGSEIGKIATNKTGKYSFVFPKGGKYKLEIKIDGLEPISKIIDLPFLDEFRPLKQKVVHFLEEGQEKVKIIDLFDEEVEGGEELIAQVLREKSSLEVNINDFDEDELRRIELEAKRADILAGLGFDGMSIREVQNQLNELAEADTKKAEQVEKLNAGITEAYIALSEEIEEITLTRDQLIAQASGETDPAEKYKTLVEAQKLDLERTKLLDQAQGLNDLTGEVKRKFGNDDPENSQMTAVENEFNRLIEEGNEEEALNYLALQDDPIQNAKGNSTEGMVEKLVQETIDQRGRQDELAQRNQTGSREIEKAKTRKVELESQLPNAKKKEAARIREELTELENTINLYSDEQEYNQKEIVEIDREIAVLDAQVDVIQSSGTSVLKEIDQRKYEDAQAVIEAQKAKDRADELSNQLAQLETNNPAITEPPVVESRTDVLLSSHSEAIEQIESFNKGDEKGRIESLITQNEQTLNQIEQELRSIENDLVESPESSDLLEDQQKLNEFKQELEDKQSDLAESLEELQPTIASTVTEETVLNEIAPDHSSTKASIESDLSLTEIERLVKLQENDESLQGSAEQKLAQLQQQLETDPTNSELLQELQVVNDVLFDTNKTIDDRAVRIEQIENQTPDVAITKEDVIADVAPNYQSEIKSIQSNTNLSDSERLEAMNEADKSLVASVESRIDEITTSLGADPANTELQGEKQVLEDVLTDLTEGISGRDNQIAGLNTNAVEPFNREETIASLQPNYQTELAEIEANIDLSELEKLQQAQELENELIQNLTDELERTENALNGDPSNARLKSQKKGIGETVAALQNQIDERAQTIDALNNSNTTAIVDVESTKQSILDEVKSDYQERLAEIQASDVAEVQRNLDQLELEQEILTALVERADDTRLGLERDPENPELSATLDAVEQLIAEQNETVQTQRKQSLEAAKSSEVYEETIAAADKKYSIEIGDLTSESKPSAEAIAAREAELQENLQSELEKKQKSLDRKYSVDVDLESMILANEIEASKERQSVAENATNVVANTDVQEEKFISELREELMANDNVELVEQNPTLEDAQNHFSDLQEYKVKLESKKIEVETQVEASPDDEALQNQLSWIEEEERKVERELQRMRIVIGDLESINVATNTSVENDLELLELETKRSDLINQLNDPNISSSERKSLDEDLNEVEQAQLKRTNDIQSETVVIAQEKQDNLNNELQRLGQNDPETTEVKSALTASEEEREAIEELLVQSDKAKSEEERNYLISQAEERQERLNNRLERVVENREIQNIEESEDITVLSREELDKRRRGFIIEIGDLEVQQDRVEGEITLAKKKELPPLVREKEAIEAQLDLLKNQLEHIEARIENFDETEPVDRMATAGLDQEITFTQEREIAASDAYKDYREEGIKALEIENELRNLQQDLNRERAELLELVAQPISADRDEQIELKTTKIKELESTIERRNQAFNDQVAIADRLLPDDEDEAMKIKNLLVRGVRPIKTAVVATALVQMPTAGFAIDPNAESVYTEENPIPVGVKNPSGLTYRVQIGAFARPIPQDLFKEFNPVSGEKIGNTNITRYMAGFFSSSESVVEARRAIRNLGYNDAFVVAYCDGERITFGRARRLEASGECVPKGTNELILEVAENTADHLGIPTQNELVELPEYSYNQAPGATEADPIELKQGLFFTVQVGVFNRPVAAEIVKNLPEIMTVRLPNGLIRYATGMFDSAEDAQSRRREAINRGISDAFIVAYYKGERLTVGRARALLREKGPSILQSNIEKTEPIEVVEIPDNVQRTDSVTTEVVETTLAAQKDEPKVQIVSKKTFEEFPRDILNRYNTEGNFYFDESDGKVKSEIYASKRELPRLFKFEKDIDTVYLSDDDVQNELDKSHVLVKLSNDKVPGDLADWLLRMGYQKKFTQTDDGLELHIEGIEPNGLQDVQYRIREVGLEPVLVEFEEDDN